jgi:hypothetical protein
LERSFLSWLIWQRSRFEDQIKQHNAKRDSLESKLSEEKAKAKNNDDDDDCSYEVTLDEDFITSLEYGMPPASGMVYCFNFCSYCTFVLECCNEMRKSNDTRQSFIFKGEYYQKGFWQEMMLKG